jgi:hypothetical protein
MSGNMGWEDSLECGRYKIELKMRLYIAIRRYRNLKAYLSQSILLQAINISNILVNSTD